MADSIFTNIRVGKFMEESFISVQVQMDTSKNDNSQIKKWYKDANDIFTKYKITAFPTFLFFNPNGNIVHVGVGLKNDSEFISLASNAIDTNRQYYTLLEKYQLGNMKITQTPDLAYLSKELGDNEMAYSIAKNYMHKYLDQLSDSDFCKKSHLAFIGDFYKMLNSKDRIFEFYYRYPKKIDSSMQQIGYSKGFVNYIIYKEEITPAINIAKADNSNPNWDILTKRIQGKYSKDVAEHNIIKAKVLWYKYKKDWNKYANYLVQSVEKSIESKLAPSVGSILYLNNNAWDIFLYSNNLEELKKAVSWVGFAISMDTTKGAGLIDTKANLLYKMGRREEAITFEQKAVCLEPNIQEFQITLEKMKRKIPTWDIPYNPKSGNNN
jgi:tetratricopeptide (TPR) repeat protein